jgi:hypothetical protein
MLLPILLAELRTGTSGILKYKCRLVLGGVGEGQRNSSLTRLAGYLLRRHVDPLVALEFLADQSVPAIIQG